MTGRDEATQEVCAAAAAAAATKEAINLSGSHAVGSYINHDRRRRNQTPKQVGRDEITLAIDKAVTAAPGKSTSLSGRRQAEAEAEAEVPSDGITAPATAATNQ